LRRADRSSISSFHLADLGRKFLQNTYLLVMLRRSGQEHRLIFSTTGEHGPRDTSEFVGERDCQHVTVEPLRRLFDPRP
jgi:hypothetical protein